MTVEGQGNYFVPVLCWTGLLPLATLRRVPQLGRKKRIQPAPSNPLCSVHMWSFWRAYLVDASPSASVLSFELVPFKELHLICVALAALLCCWNVSWDEGVHIIEF